MRKLTFMQIVLLKRQGCFFNSVALGPTLKYFKFQRSGSKASSLAFTYSPACCGS